MKMRQVLPALAWNESGLALIEFALCLPVILTMGLAGAELAHQALATERVNQIAMLVADNAGRVRDSIDEMDVNEIMTGAKLVGDSIKFSQNARIILSDVQNNQLNTGQWIRWQRCAGAKNVVSTYGVEGDGRLLPTLPAIGPASNQIAASTGTIVMFVEVVYDYQPIIPVNYFSPTTIRATAAFNVRQRAPVSDKDPITGLPMATPPKDIMNSKNLTGSAYSNCGVYSA